MSLLTTSEFKRKYPLATHDQLHAFQLFCRQLSPPAAPQVHPDCPSRSPPRDTKITTTPYIKAFQPILDNPDYSLQIETAEINPDLDIEPTGAYCIRTDASISPSLSHLYAPTGHHLFQISTNTLTSLHNDYMATRQPSNCATPFPAHLYQLLTRYKTGYREHNHTTDMRNHWATPPDLLRAIAQSFSTEMEWFASPLNHSHTIPQYCSAYKEDTLFGARHDAYKHVWTRSGQCNPEYTYDQMFKATKWAINSTLSDDPSLTIMVLPHWSSYAYEKFLHHPAVHTLATIPANQLGFVPPTHHMHADAPPARFPAAKWPVLILLVANPKGLDAFVRTQHLQQLQTTLNSYGCNITDLATNLASYTSQRNDPTEAGETFTLSQAFLAAQPLATTPPPAPPSIPLPEAFTQPPQLRYDKSQFVYTDGSKVGTAIGASVFDPTQKAVWRISFKDHDGRINTNLRAELAAIFCALSNTPARTQLHILTDSLTSLQLINTVLYNPERLRFHKHKHMLHATMAHILLRESRIICGKVRAHTNVWGNDIADMVAKQATHTDVSTSPHVCMPPGTAETDAEFTAFPNAGRGSSWLSYDKADGELWEVDDLQTHVNTLTAKTTYKHLWKRATKNEKSMPAYLKVLADTTLPGKGLCHTSIPRMKGSSLPHKQRKFVNNTRYGTLWTTVMQQRYSGQPASPAPRCPLCRLSDGIAHCLGACKHPEVHALITARHGNLAHSISTTIGSSNVGNCLLFTDAETHPPRYTQLPIWLVPPHHRTTKPDIIMITNADKNDLHTRTTALSRARRKDHHIHILEVKCPNKFGIHRTVPAALNQHTGQATHLRPIGLATHLRNNGWRVTCHALIIDNTGIVPVSTFEALSAIGLAPRVITKLIPELQLLAIQGSYAVYTKRQTLLHAMPAGIG